MKNKFTRTELLLQKENMTILQNSKIVIVGIGGVGSYAVEALARCGIGHFVLIDYDVIDVTNINRQLHALNSTVGKPKVEVMQNRILDINENAKVEIYQTLYDENTKNELIPNDANYVIDAIDIVSKKVLLIKECVERELSIISSMGAGNKLNPTMFSIANLKNTQNCPLAKIMRKKLRKHGIQDLKVVYSPEKPQECKTTEMQKDSETRPIIGSISFVPSTVGMIIASEIIKDLIKNTTH